jgi:hypothetical protein
MPARMSSKGTRVDNYPRASNAPSCDRSRRMTSNDVVVVGCRGRDEIRQCDGDAGAGSGLPADLHLTNLTMTSGNLTYQATHSIDYGGHERGDKRQRERDFYGGNDYYARSGISRHGRGKWNDVPRGDSVRW